MCFDVPVKLYSLNYLLMAIFLIAPEFPRIVPALVLGKAVEARPFAPLLGRAARSTRPGVADAPRGRDGLWPDPPKL